MTPRNPPGRSRHEVDPHAVRRYHEMQQPQAGPGARWAVYVAAPIVILVLLAVLL